MKTHLEILLSLIILWRHVYIYEIFCTSLNIIDIDGPWIPKFPHLFTFSAKNYNLETCIVNLMKSHCWKFIGGDKIY